MDVEIKMLRALINASEALHKKTKGWDVVATALLDEVEPLREQGTEEEERLFEDVTEEVGVILEERWEGSPSLMRKTIIEFRDRLLKKRGTRFAVEGPLALMEIPSAGTGVYTLNGERGYYDSYSQWRTV